MVEELERLRTTLQATEPGALDVTSELRQAWDYLEGGSDGGMEAYKLHLRTRNMTWDPPILSFDIERHGAIVAGGSGYAEIQTWDVDIDKGTASIVNTRNRRVLPMQPRFDTEALAKELAEVITSHREDPRIRWSKDGTRVQVRFGAALPAASQQTSEGRRKRLNKTLSERLESLRWTRRAGGWWVPPKEDT